MRYMVNNSPRVIEAQVREIMAGDLPDPTEATLGSRLEAVAQIDAMCVANGRHRPSTQSLATLLGVTTRTIERYRRRLRLYSLG